MIYPISFIKILMEISTNVVNQGAIDQGSTTQVKKGRKALKIKWKLGRKLADNETSQEVVQTLSVTALSGVVCLNYNLFSCFMFWDRCEFRIASFIPFK